MWGQQPPNKLVQAVEDVLKKLAFGEETPKVTKKALEKLNKQAQESTEYSVGVPTVKQLKENIMFIETDNLIHESKDIWDFETAIEENLEDFKEMNMHNQSYVL
jgi:hypothetical protein